MWGSQDCKVVAKQEYRILCSAVHQPDHVVVKSLPLGLRDSEVAVLDLHNIVGVWVDSFGHVFDIVTESGDLLPLHRCEVLPPAMLVTHTGSEAPGIAGSSGGVTGVVGSAIVSTGDHLARARWAVKGVMSGESGVVHVYWSVASGSGDEEHHR